MSSRWDKLELLQKHFSNFPDFLEYIMTEQLGYKTSDIQRDIADYLENGPQKLMIMAQRSQAKSTIACIYLVYQAIHHPYYRFVIFSAASDVAGQLMHLIINLIESTEILECLRPEKGRDNLDRKSMQAYDIHHDLKGIDKSPSFTCLGITANMQGLRADILLSDDVESSKNAYTPKMRERLKLLTKDYTSICSAGRIIFLGTPQTNLSIYNDLKSRGYDIRIWPGRYPTDQELQNYGDSLAPLLLQRIKDNPELQTGGGLALNKGKCIDPVINPETELLKKEIDQGSSYFELQYMLNTSISDEARYPLKIRDILFMNIPIRYPPLKLRFSRTPEAVIPTDYYLDISIRDKFYQVESVDYAEQELKYNPPICYIDPAGGGRNADETGVSIATFASGRVYILDCFGIQGQLNEPQLQKLLERVRKQQVALCIVEENYGAGIFKNVIQGYFKDQGYQTGFTDIRVTGQKESRIIDILEPVLSTHRLIMDQSLIEKDFYSLSAYPVSRRYQYSMFHQISRLTHDKDALEHDDKVEALAGAVQYFKPWLARTQLMYEKEDDKHKSVLLQQNPLMIDKIDNNPFYQPYDRASKHDITWR